MGYTTDEAKVTNDILTYLENLKKFDHPIYWEHRSGQGGFGYKKGTPDLFIVYNGLHLEVEIKGAFGKRSSSQDKFKWKCETIWHIPYCCPHSLEEFVDWFLDVVFPVPITLTREEK